MSSHRPRAPLPPLPLPKPSAEYTARLLRDKEVAPRDKEVVAGPLPASAASDGCPYIGLPIWGSNPQLVDDRLVCSSHGRAPPRYRYRAQGLKGRVPG